MRQLPRGIDISDCVSEETEAATFHIPVGEEVKDCQVQKDFLHIDVKSQEHTSLIRVSINLGERLHIYSFVLNYLFVLTCYINYDRRRKIYTNVYLTMSNGGFELS